MLPVFLLLVFGIIDVGRLRLHDQRVQPGGPRRRPLRLGRAVVVQLPGSVSVASQTRFTCTAAVAIDRIAGSAGVLRASNVTCTTDGTNSVAASAVARGTS